jgi:hypothetical protein
MYSFAEDDLNTSIGFVLIIKHIIPVYILGIRQCNRFCNDNQSFQQMCSACICKKNNIFDQKWTDNSFVHTVSRISRANLSHSVHPNHIGGVMVNVRTSSKVDRWLEPHSGQTKDYIICICCFSAKHAAIRKKSKDWLVRNQDNVWEWGDMSTHRLLFQWANTIKIQLSVLV